MLLTAAAAPSHMTAHSVDIPPLSNQPLSSTPTRPSHTNSNAANSQQPPAPSSVLSTLADLSLIAAQHPTTTSTPASPSSSSSSSSSSSPTAATTTTPTHHHANTHQIKIKLREIPFFAEINESKLSTLASYFEFRRCEAGEVICRQGDEANGFSVLVSGEVRVSVAGPGGGQVTLNTLKEGDWFGEIALVQNTLRTATLTSITPCLLLYLSSSRFLTFLTLAPELKQRLFDSIISRRTANSLKAIPLFSFLARMEGGARTFDEQKLQLLGEMFTFEDYRSNHVVFEEGDRADAFYIIQKGTVGVYARRGANDEEMMARSRQDERNRGGGRRRGVGGVEDDDGSDDDTGDSSSAQDDDSDSGCSCSDGSPKHGPQHSQQLTSSTSAPGTASSPTAVSSAGILLNELTKNDWFGEIALVSNTRRTATVITKTPCIMFKLLSRDFDRFLAIVPQVKDKFSKVQSQRIATTLSNIPFFRHVRENKPASKLTVLGGMFTFEHYEAGQSVCREGEPFDKFVIIVDGHVDVTKSIQATQPAPAESAESVLLETLEKNNWFGEMQLIGDKPMLTSFICRDDCLVLSVTRDKFTRFIKIAPEIVDHFSKLVTYRTASMLHDCDLFEIIEDRKWSKLELFCSMFDYEFVWKDIDVMKEGEMKEDTDKFYIIQQGSVRMTSGGRLMHEQEGSSQLEKSEENKQDSVSSDGKEEGGGGEAVVEEQKATTATPAVNTASSSPASGHSSAASSSPSTPRHNLTIHISTPTFPPSHTRTPSTTNVLDRGAYFGELSLLRSLPRPHTIHTLTPCVFLTLPRRKFHQFCKVAPEIRAGLERRWPQYAGGEAGSEGKPQSPFHPDEDDNGGGGGGRSGVDGSGGATRHYYNPFYARVEEEQKLQQRLSSTLATGARRVGGSADEQKHHR